MSHQRTQANVVSPDFDVERIRADFPALHQKVHGKPLVYLDNAATTHKPKAVIQRVSDFYAKDNSNVHRGVHALSARATLAYIEARKTIQALLSAESDKEIIFTKGTTESINLVAQSYGRTHFKPGDEILITTMEHHANIVPWQLIAEQTGALLKVAPINEDGECSLEDFANCLSDKTAFVSIVHLSNVLGTLNPVKKMIKMAHAVGAKVLIDGAQAIAHCEIDVKALDCDFYVFSGHKVYGPTGIGVLYGKEALLEAMPPYQGGGDMIRRVTFEKTEYNELPFKFEAGTPNIAGVLGLAAAVEYLLALDIQKVAAYEASLLSYATSRAKETPGFRIIGEAKHKSSVLSFVLDSAHPHDIGTILDHQGVAVRAGHHCAMPLMERYGLPATARASFAFYNTHEEIDKLFAAIEHVNAIFN